MNIDDTICVWEESDREGGQVDSARDISIPMSSMNKNFELVWTLTLLDRKKESCVQEYRRKIEKEHADVLLKSTKLSHD